MTTKKRTSKKTKEASAATVGTHNSMTFLPPRRWWGWAAIPFARCQSRDLGRQFADGARCFDLRVRFDSNGDPFFAHGLLRFRGSVPKTLDALSTLAAGSGETVCVRLILEDLKDRWPSAMAFCRFCKAAEDAYPLLRFFGGNRKCDWNQLYQFAFKPTLVQAVGSMAADARWYERIIPWLYARRSNRSNTPQPGCITIYDFLRGKEEMK